MRVLPPPPFIESLGARSILMYALERLGANRVALASSFGVEDMVLLDLLTQLDPQPRIFTLDTGRLPQETYDLMDQVRARYGIRIEVYVPETISLQQLLQGRGVNLFYESIEARRACCEVRKLEPFRRALSTLDGWITGVRRDQITTRAGTPKIGFDLENRMTWKIAPLADWSEQQVWDYVHEHDVPYNALHDQGYPSIGCAPCTRPVMPGMDPRSGRWWWEQPDQRECGLHVAEHPRAPVVPTTGAVSQAARGRVLTDA